MKIMSVHVAMVTKDREEKNAFFNMLIFIYMALQEHQK